MDLIGGISLRKEYVYNGWRLEVRFITNEVFNVAIHMEEMIHNSKYESWDTFLERKLYEAANEYINKSVTNVMSLLHNPPKPVKVNFKPLEEDLSFTHPSIGLKYETVQFIKPQSDSHLEQDLKRFQHDWEYAKMYGKPGNYQVTVQPKQHGKSAAQQKVKEKTKSMQFANGSQQKSVLEKIPGLKATITTGCPYPKCTHNKNSPTTIWYMIQHVNDSHDWTLEQIADWTESLDADLQVKTKPNPPVEKHPNKELWDKLIGSEVKVAVDPAFPDNVVVFMHNPGPVVTSEMYKTSEQHASDLSKAVSESIISKNEAFKMLYGGWDSKLLPTEIQPDELVKSFHEKYPNLLKHADGLEKQLTTGQEVAKFQEADASYKSVLHKWLSDYSAMKSEFEGKWKNEPGKKHS